MSQVAGSPDNTGTANTVVTLSSGQYRAESYEIMVKLTANYTNATQAVTEKTATLTVCKPAGTNEITGAGTISESPLLVHVAGTYGSTSDVTYTVGLKYNKSGTNPQGKMTVAIPQADGSIVYIKSNSISSINVTSFTTDDGGKTATIYTKLSIYKIDSLGAMTTLDDNVTLRMDIVEYTKLVSAGGRQIRLASPCSPPRLASCTIQTTGCL